MAERRMFAKTIVCSDKFLELPVSARLLYFTLGMNAYDRGVLINAKTLALSTDCSLNDIDELVKHGYLYPVEDGHYFITHWYENNGIGENAKKRNNYSYRQWRKAVIDRDGKCVECGSKEKLHAHHIKPFAEYPDLRLDIDNGITLCEKCHRKLHGLEKKHGEKKDV